MIDKYLSLLWDAVGPGLANHLWQSTLLAAAAGLLAVFLRRHHARARYWLWLAASLKFLVPFSWLVSIGSRVAWRSVSATQPSLYLVEEIGQPFTRSATSAIPSHVPPISTPTLIHVLPALGVIWLCGFVAVVVVWGVRWLRIFSAMKSAEPLSDGREVGALRRIERLGGVRKPISMLLSRSSLEPGIFGITNPVLLWPEGISTHLEDAHLEAILAHEVWHVRRRDNLFAALHMLVEAVFWFYPLVWWLGARLVEERERACDEEVVELGSDRQVYAESILKVCEFCLGSPLPCVSGVTGADLKKRMVHIMTARILHKLNFAKKLLLTSAATLALAVPVTVGLLHPTASRAQDQAASTPASPTFESVSIKPDTNTENGMFHTKIGFSLNDGNFTARGITLQMLIRMAYRVQDSQVSGGPDWLKTQKFDIDAKLNPTVANEMLKQTKDTKSFDDQAALKTLLSQYFKLALHSENKDLPVYDLVVADGGPKLQEAKGPSLFHLEPGELTSSGIPIRLLADELSRRLGQTVLDKTGLKSSYAFTLRWTPEQNEDVRVIEQRGATPVPVTKSAEPPAASIFDALQEQLGLKLEARTGAVPALVVDHAEQPSEN